MLGHKLKDLRMLIREYYRTLPRIPAYGVELNQVWTNLLDNADRCHSKGRSYLGCERV